MHSHIKATNNVNKLTHCTHWRLVLSIVQDEVLLTEDETMQIKLNHMFILLYVCLSVSSYLSHQLN